jgi:GT2 family glycosyltransferase
VTVAVVAYNSGPWLQPCLEALAAQSFGDFEAVVLDNASTDGAVDKLTPPDPRFRVERMGANLGFAAACNRAAEASRAEFFVTLNPDTAVEPRWLESLVAAAERRPDAASFGSLQLNMGDPTVVDGAGDVWHAAGAGWRALHGRPLKRVPPGERETFGACGAAALYRRREFVEAGAFDERFFCYCEDLDLSFRLRLLGRTAVQAPGAVVRHVGSASSGVSSEFTVFHGHRNRIWTFVKNTPGPLLWLLLPYHLVLNLYLLVVAVRIGRLRTMLRAYEAALRGLPEVWGDRRRVQAQRRIGLGEAARQLKWSPLALKRRDVYAR